MIYDYRENMQDDIFEYIKENYTPETLPSKDTLYEELWIEDSVTGNASGSYTANKIRAEDNICHNLELLKEACLEFCYSGLELLERGAEFCDVIIRCYLLGEVLNTVYEELQNYKGDKRWPLTLKQ